eukprot:3715997-Pyramimonas_sp.AAC.1
MRWQRKPEVKKERRTHAQGLKQGIILWTLRVSPPAHPETISRAAGESGAAGRTRSPAAPESPAPLLIVGLFLGALLGPSWGSF